MQANALQLALAALLVSSAYGQIIPDRAAPSQLVDRTFHFMNPPSPEGFQEAASIMRTVALIGDVAVDPASATLSIHGTSGNAAMAEWLMQQMDQPAILNPGVQELRDMAAHEYRTPGHNDDVVRAVYLNHTPTPQGVQELLTILRTVSDIQHIFSYRSPGMIVLRATTAEGWRGPVGDDVLRVFYPANRHSMQDLGAIVKAGRTNLHIMEAFNSTTQGAVVFRGTAAQISQADQLIATMDRPAGN